MTYITTHGGMVTIEDSQRILRAFFPGYRELTPCSPARALWPVAQLNEKSCLRDCS